MSDAPSSDRRDSKRYPVGLRVLFRRNDTAFFLDTETVNVSASGAFVKTRRRPLSEGTQVVLMFNDLDFFDSKTVIRGVVTRTQEDESASEPRGMGIRFEGMTDSEQEALATALQRLGD